MHFLFATFVKLKLLCSGYLAVVISSIFTVEWFYVYLLFLAVVAVASTPLFWVLTDESALFNLGLR